MRYVGRDDLAKTAADHAEDYTFADRNATFISSVAAHVNGASDSIKEACAEHARFWQIEDECNAAIDKIASYTPPSLKEASYAIPELRKYAAYDADSTVTAASAFYDHRDRYPRAMRKSAAVRLIERAERFGANMPAYLDRYLHKAAGFGYPSVETLEDALVQRLNLLKAAQDSEAEQLSAVFGAFIKNASARYDDRLVDDLISVVEKFDATTGLTPKYGECLDLPEEMIDGSLTTGEMTKVAGGIKKMAVKLTNGQTVDVTQITKEALSAVDGELAELGEDELVDVLPTLPRPEADLLARLIN